VAAEQRLTWSNNKTKANAPLVDLHRKDNVKRTFQNFINGNLKGQQ
jgi:hypothetical protein